jgi:DNA topoisomerase VI subunit A
MTILDYAKIIGNTAYNIKNYNKNSFSKKLNISKKAYKRITFSLLSHKNTLNTPNYKLISNHLERIKV